MQPARPFLKYVGGKAKLLPELLPHVPEEISTYCEPFIGGGALFFSVAAGRRFQHARLSDKNLQLIDTYRAVQTAVESVISELRVCEYAREFYYAMRAHKPRSLVEVAVRTIYLNKTCFNGLYRVNKRGEFNVPFGKYDNPTICDADNLRACSQALVDVELVNCDFEDVLNTCTLGDFAYCDPPYVPVSQTARFTHYTADGFSMSDQQRLASATLAARSRGVSVMLSNADVPVVRALYAAGCSVSPVLAGRNINSKGDHRGKVGELVIRNF